MAKQTYINVSGKNKKVVNCWEKINGEWTPQLMPKILYNGNYYECMEYYKRGLLAASRDRIDIIDYEGNIVNSTTSFPNSIWNRKCHPSDGLSILGLTPKSYYLLDNKLNIIWRKPLPDNITLRGDGYDLYYGIVVNVDRKYCFIIFHYFNYDKKENVYTIFKIDKKNGDIAKRIESFNINYFELYAYSKPNSDLVFFRYDSYNPVSYFVINKELEQIETIKYTALYGGVTLISEDDSYLYFNSRFVNTDVRPSRVDIKVNRINKSSGKVDHIYHIYRSVENGYDRNVQTMSIENGLFTNEMYGAGDERYTILDKELNKTSSRYDSISGYQSLYTSKKSIYLCEITHDFSKKICEFKDGELKLLFSYDHKIKDIFWYELAGEYRSFPSRYK